MTEILIIDDDPFVCESMELVIRDELPEYQVRSCHTLAEGLSRAESEAYDVVFLDVLLPDGNGLEALPRIRDSLDFPEVIIITGKGDANGAELAIKCGAWDYITKPFTIDSLKLPLIRALDYRKEKTRKPTLFLNREKIIGSSPSIKLCLENVAHSAGSDAGVLITGETGTGKELFARAIHANSSRQNGPFVVVDCAALPETLVESVLFGHTRGAFTGADKNKTGLILQAHGGTLFLDEIGELPLSLQKSFLRVLQEHRFRPVGGKQEQYSDFRIVAATLRNLDQMTERGEFRQDLLFRLRSFSIHIPPLRERPEDIKELTSHFLGQLCDRYKMGIKGCSPGFLEAVSSYTWPGNVRELIHALERAVTSASYEETLYPKHLPDEIRIYLARNLFESVSPEPEKKDSNPSEISKELPSLKEFRKAAADEAEKTYLKYLFEKVGNDLKAACRISGMSRSRFYEMLKKHQISAPR